MSSQFIIKNVQKHSQNKNMFNPDVFVSFRLVVVDICQWIITY